ncbi:cisplatin damage response ATP-dependent DNA ligase [Sphingobium subterraneum]|uniref:DNA ligase (ATP) n=1 Tax=Sphingobium subterraneum TaxID=627688 RepID=A0A841J6T5_9SPHN|nr:cisplatin damage response ATP-dependent DNA ligase [Sphingobium subterraneum]MBB6124245.1 DNA ligase-1 [Sphingobium subterraneum]
MRRFSDLIDRLVYTRSRNAKVKLIADYLRATPDPDRGWALASLTGQLDLAAVKPALVKALIEERVDPELFRMSRNYVGDLAETCSLLWPEPPGRPTPVVVPPLGEVVETLKALPRGQGAATMTTLMDRLDVPGRYALIKLATGALRIGISARLAKTAFAQAFDVDVEEVEEIWHGLVPPYLPLFQWGEGHIERPRYDDIPVFRPFMLAHPLEDGAVDLTDYAAEWKWDGIRVQIARAGGETRLFSRTGDDITNSFPEVAEAMPIDAVLDGELLVRGTAQGNSAASFNALQQRLGRKAVSGAMLRDFPAFVRLYDVLYDGAQDLRGQPWTERRERLEAMMARLPGERFDLSGLIVAGDFAQLAALREGARDASIEGLMLKRRDSLYSAGRKVGLWYKWKRDPLVVDCVMMYAQRGSGKRSSFYSDYTFGCWSEDGTLLPVGKAYSGFTDAELKMLDGFVRNNTVAKFGPVREVTKSLVLEVAFDSVHRSKRHKSGVAMRFPRISRIRTDKPAEEADTLETLAKLITDPV